MERSRSSDRDKRSSVCRSPELMPTTRASAGSLNLGPRPRHRSMKSMLLITLLTSVLASPVYAQFLGGSAAAEQDSMEKPLRQRSVPEGRTPDRSMRPPQQVDFSAQEQVDFSMNTPLPGTPVDPRKRTAARRSPGEIDRAVNRLADQAVDSRVGASDTRKNEVDHPGRIGSGGAPRGSAETQR